MANKKIQNQIQKKGKSVAKKTAKKGAKKAVKSVSAEFGRDERKSAAKPRRGMTSKILPYGFLVFALILAICFIIVHVAGLDDGAGVLGYGIVWLMGGLFGGASVLLPVLFAFLGLKWCLHNIKWKEADMDPNSAYYDDYRRAKRRLLLQGIMASLSLLTISAIFGVIADYGSFDLEEMWTDGAEELFVGGGILGSSLGCLMVTAFETVISMVLLIILLVLFVIFTLGLTPDYIITKIQEKQALRREERAYFAEQERLEEEKRRAAEQKQRAAAAAAATTASKAARKRKMEEPKAESAKSLSAEEIARLTEEESEEEEIYIGPARDAEPAPTADPVAQMLNQDTKEAKEAEEARDYGGDTGFDSNEYGKLEDFFKNLNQTPAQGEQPRAESAPATPLELSELGTDELLSDVAAVVPEEGGEEEEEIAMPYVFPPLDLLTPNKNKEEQDYTAELQENARQLLSTLKSFKINIKEINYSRGPTITRYELKPEAGVRVRSIANLVDDIALSLATSGVRIEAPIPGKPAVGIEVPNRNRATVYLRDLIENPQFNEAKSKLTASLGMDVGGNPIYFDITKMPHMIIAGATGMGKSVCINCVIMSILYKARPEDVKLILIDPKKVEFALYRDIPHLYAPIVSEPKKAAGALASAVAEMERRFELIEEVGVRDIASYNAATENDPYKEHMPHMVIIIDELADLMMTAPDEVESSICRLAQKARAAGIHIIIGTQRPSVDVITGLIKANIPSRIACTVASQVDSRTIIDIAGAEKLIGRGDMLFAPVGAAKPLRVQGAFVTEKEVEDIVTFIKENNTKAKYNSEFVNRIEEEAAKCGMKKGGGGSSELLPESEGGDSKFHDAVKLAVEEGKISTSLMQRRLGVGYGRAAKIIDTMEQMGYVSKPDGNKPRRVLLTAEEYSRRVMEGTLGDSEE